LTRPIVECLLFGALRWTGIESCCTIMGALMGTVATQPRLHGFNLDHWGHYDVPAWGLSFTVS
jgi:hypothetical protein